MENFKAKLLFYIDYLNFIGGVEQWMYYISKKYSKDYDISLLYTKGTPQQLLRLKKMINCVKYDGQKIKCDKVIFCYGFSPIDNIEANSYELVIHADYKAQNIIIDIPKKISKIYAVSKTAQKSFKEMYNIEPTLLYNPIMMDEPKKVLRLISATRLTKEKGGKRMLEMSKALNKAKIPFIWTVFSNDRFDEQIDGLIFMNPVMNIVDYIKDSDYLVQLSDTEGYAYSIVESLTLNVPVIVTKIPVATEMGIIDGKNGYLLDFDLSNLDVNKIYNNIPKFEYIPKHSEPEWLKILGKPSKSKYKPSKMLYEVKACFEFYYKYFDDIVTINRIGKEEKGVIFYGDTFIVDESAMDYLLNTNPTGKKLVEVVNII